MLTNIAVELPWSTLASLFVFFPFYFLVGMDKNAAVTRDTMERGYTMFLLCWVFLFLESTFADMIIASVESADVGAVIALTLFGLSFAFCG